MKIRRQNSAPSSLARSFSAALLRVPLCWAALAWLPPPAAALELTGATDACHDPSRMIEWDGRYYVFSTAPNVNVRSSADLVSWRWEDRAFSFEAGIPPWMVAIDDQLPEPERNLWAPDIIDVPTGGGGRSFLLFYSRNLLHPHHHPEQDERSLLGVATSSSVAGPYTDGGEVLNVHLFTDYYRVIDPAPFFDQDEQLWVAVGSYGSPNGNGFDNGGIRIFQVNEQTGKLVTPGDDGTRIAGSWIEAPYVHFHDGYYYLFFNQGRCCEGLNSTYFVRVGRATSIAGPYTDQDGASLLTPTSGGTLFMGLDFEANHTGTETAAVPRPQRGSIGRELGPGHVGIATPADGIERVTYHYYDTAASGEPTLGLKTLLWGADGWPRPGWAPSDGTYAVGTAINAQPNSPALWLAEGAAGPSLEHYQGTPQHLWDVRRVAPNHYLLVSAESGQSLRAEGSDVVFAEEDASDTAQTWHIEQTNDGSFLLKNGASGNCAVVPASDVTPGSPAALAPCDAAVARQRWFVTPAGAYRIRNEHSSLVASGAQDGSVVQTTEADTESQYWWLVPTVQGSTKMIQVESSLLLGLEDGSADGAATVLREDENADHQRWYIDVLTDGSLRFVPRSSGTALGVAEASTSAGAPLEHRRWLHTRNQQWTLDPVARLDDRTPPGLPEPGEDGGGGTNGNGSGGTNGNDGGTGGGSPGDVPGDANGGSGGNVPGAEDDDAGAGCACRMRVGQPSSWSSLLIAGLVALGLTRRRFSLR